MLAPGFSNILGACLLKPFCPKLEISILISVYLFTIIYENLVLGQDNIPIPLMKIYSPIDVRLMI